MAGTPPEDLLEWLLREEEVLGIGAVERGLVDIDSARRLLYEELGYEPTDAQLAAFAEGGALKYERLPEIGVRFEMVEYTYGFRPWYRDIATGQRVSKADVSAAIALTL